MSRRALTSLGITNVFSPTAAQLSAIISPRSADAQPAHVNTVRHTVSQEASRLLLASAVMSCRLVCNLGGTWSLPVLQVTMEMDENGAQAQAVTESGSMVGSRSEDY